MNRRQQSMRRWQQKHKEEQRAYKRQYYLKNKDTILKERRLYYRKNKAAVLSRVAQHRKDHLAQDRARSRAYYKKNRGKILASCRARQLQLNELKARPCTDCGVQYPPCVMDFDHVRGRKKFGIGSGLVTRKWSNVLNEIAKCDLVCANCHRLRTQKRRKP